MQHIIFYAHVHACSPGYCILTRNKIPSWQSFCSSQENQAPRDKLILCLFALLWTPPNFTVTTFIESCSRSDPGQSDAAADFLRSLPTSDAVVVTDGFVPSPLGSRGAGVQAVYVRCLSNSSLSYSAGPVFSSFSAEFLALVHVLE